MSNEIKDVGGEFDFVLEQNKTKSLMPEPVETINTAPAPNIQVKARIKLEDIPEDKRQMSYTADDLKRITEEVIAKSKAYTDSVAFTGKTQVISKKNAPIIDFSSLTQEDVYNLDIPIEAKAFMAGDPLKVNLKDSNYEARWVLTQSQRLGYMKSIGFSYVSAEDLADQLETEVSTDASGHFTINDVVLMRIQKVRYYPALRAAHQRAVNTMQSAQASKSGMSTASDYMVRESGGDFNEAQNSGQMQFYTPGR